MGYLDTNGLSRLWMHINSKLDSTGNVPIVSEPNMQLVTDSNGETKWEKRTHWEDVTQKTILETMTVELDPENGSYNAPIGTQIEPMVVGKEYIFSWGSKNYTCISQFFDFGEGITGIFCGNLSFLDREDTGEPFGFAYIPEENQALTGMVFSLVSSEELTSISLSIIQNDVDIHPIDSKYLSADITDKKKITITLIPDGDRENLFGVDTPFEEAWDLSAPELQKAIQVYSPVAGDLQGTNIVATNLEQLSVVAVSKNTYNLSNDGTILDIIFFQLIHYPVVTSSDAVCKLTPCLWMRDTYTNGLHYERRMVGTDETLLPSDLKDGVLYVEDNKNFTTYSFDELKNSLNLSATDIKNGVTSVNNQTGDVTIDAVKKLSDTAGTLSLVNYNTQYGFEETDGTYGYSPRVDKTTGNIQIKTVSDAGTKWHTVYTHLNPPVINNVNNANTATTAQSLYKNGQTLEVVTYPEQICVNAAYPVTVDGEDKTYELSLRAKRNDGNVQIKTVTDSGSKFHTLYSDQNKPNANVIQGLDVYIHNYLTSNEFILDCT